MKYTVLKSMSFVALTLLCLSGTQVMSDSIPEVISGGGAKHQFKHMLQNSPKQIIKKSSISITNGWNYFTCQGVVWAKEGKYNKIYIMNDDESFFYAGTTSNSPSIEQEILMRACLKSGDEYAVYITNTSRRTWNSVAAK